MVAGIGVAGTGVNLAILTRKGGRTGAVVVSTQGWIAGGSILALVVLVNIAGAVIVLALRSIVTCEASTRIVPS